MGLGAHTALTAAKNEKVAEENWLERLRQWLVECPRCSEVRLVVGARENDQYVCKDCGQSFAIKLPARPKPIQLSDRGSQ